MSTWMHNTNEEIINKYIILLKPQKYRSYIGIGRFILRLFNDGFPTAYVM